MQTHTHLTELIDACPMFSAKDKTYWKEKLPTMLPEQIQKLENICERAAKLNWAEEAAKATAALGRASIISERSSL